MSPSSPAKEYVYSAGRLIAVRQLGNAGPNVSVAANGSTFSAPASVVLTATASDSDGVQGVEFYENGVLLGTDTTSPYQYTWSSVPAGAYTVTARATDALGLSENADPIQITVGAVSYTESGGLLSMEAEDGLPIDRVDAWIDRTDVAGFSGTGFVRAEPDDGSVYSTGYASNAPELRIPATFSTTGTYYVWVRGYASSTSDNSLHVGVDNVAVSSAENINFETTGAWIWAGDISVGGRATLSIASAGSHTINLWARVDGVRVDKIILTTDPYYIPGVWDLSFEAESGTIVNRTKSWVARTTVAGYSGSSYLEAETNTGVSQDTGYVGVSPEVQLSVSFPTTGAYYVWVRGNGASGTDDSLHVGLDGAAVSTADRIAHFDKGSGGWVWSNDTLDAARATLTISTAGAHTVNVWMREDGMRFDKIAFTTDPSYVPPEALVEVNGHIGLEGEWGTNYSSTYWELNNNFSGYQWTGFIHSKNVDGTGSSCSQSAPCGPVEYNVYFNTTGAYYVWVRAAPVNMKMVHVGIDTGLGSAGSIVINSSGWLWSKDRHPSYGGGVATITVSTIGYHTIKLYEGDPGVRVDRIILNKSSGYVP